MVESNSKAIWFDRGCPISIQKRVNGHFLLIFDILNRVPLSINQTDWNPLSVVESSLLINSDDRNLSNMNHIRSILYVCFGEYCDSHVAVSIPGKNYQQHRFVT